MAKSTDPAASLADAAKTLAAAEKDARARGLEQLVEWSAQRNMILPAFQALNSQGKAGARLALEYIAILPTIPRSLILMAAPLLQDNAVPLSVRMNVASRFLTILPDQREAVGPIVRSVTAGLNRRRTLHRLILLQNRVEKCEALDQIVAETEARVRFKCPVCRKNFHRPSLIKHLWKKHRTQLIDGHLIKPADAAERLVERAKSDTDGLDHAFLSTPHIFPKSKPIDILQGLASRHWRSSDQYALLADRAADHHQGLCPKCYSPVADAIPPLAGPLNLSHGRLSGDGYTVEIKSTAGFRSILITAPDGTRMKDSGRRTRLSPRQAAVYMAAPIGLIGLIATIVMPKGQPDLFWLAIWFSLAVVIVYAGIWAWRKPLPIEDDQCVDLAWEMLAPGIGRSPAAVQFLTRLCRTSIRTGDAAERSQTVWELGDHAAVLSEKGGPYVGLFAATSILKACDAAKLGRDRVGELAAFLTGFFKRDISAPVAEHAAEIIRGDVALTNAESHRLSIVLAAAAFDAGLTPTDLSSLRRFLPAFTNLLPDDAEYFAALETVWRQRSEKPWAKAGEIDTIFTLCKSKPGLANRVLNRDPDALLVHIPDDFLNDLLGPVTVNRRGVSFGGAVVADPNAEVTCVLTPTGGELVFGKNTFALDRRPSDAFERTLKRLLRYRAESLMPEIDHENTVSGKVDRFLESIAVPCPLCRTTSRIRSGQLGVA